MITKLLEDIKNGKDWEEEIFNIACNIAVILAKLVFTRLDAEMFKLRDTKNLRFVNKREKTLITRFGQITINRNYFKDKEMNCCRHLLDEKLGIEKHKTISPRITSLSTMLATLMSFRVAGFAVSKLLPRSASISHQAIHTNLQKEAKKYDDNQRARMEALFKDGVVPFDLNQKEIDSLFVESDGCWINLQREEKKDMELKLGIAYEGLKQIAKDKFQTVNKLVFGGNYPSEEFWKGFLTKLNYKYKMGSIKNIFLGGDGAPWIKAGVDFLKNPKFYLDKFHQVQALMRAFSFKAEKAAKTLEAIETNKFDEALILLKDEEKANPKKAQIIQKTVTYLTNNKDHLVKGKEIEGLGAMESNIDKTLADRFKKRSMSWTKDGAHNMVKMIELRLNEPIENILTYFVPKQDQELSKAIKAVKKATKQDSGEWLNVVMPALVGSHADRPWVKMLRKIAHS